VFHGSLLLPYYETKEHGRNFLELTPDLIEGQPEWEVEAIQAQTAIPNQVERVF